MDWGANELVVGKPSIRIPWTTEKHLGETSDSDGYTTDLSELKDSTMSYYVEHFEHQSKASYGFSNAVFEQVPKEISEPILEDRSLGESNVPLTAKWIAQQISSGNLPTGEGEAAESGWENLAFFSEEVNLEKVKPVVSPTEYEKVDVAPKRSFYLNKLLTDRVKSGYIELLREYINIFAWESSNLKGIPPI